jgi:hypothetical protein
VLFHVGSAGFRHSLGDGAYLEMIRVILSLLGGRVEEILYGPGDDDVAAALRREFPPMRMECRGLEALAERTRNFEGTLLCFNSFFAHFCRYLGKPAVVIHQIRMTYGYDCDPPHRQIILGSNPFEDLRREIGGIPFPAAGK